MEKARWYRKRRVWLLSVALGVAILLLAHRPISRGIAALPVLDEPLEPSDLIVVSGGDLPDIHYAVDLYHQGYGSRIALIGNFPVALQVLSEEPFDVIEKPWDEVAARLVVHAGVSAEDLLFSESYDTSTYDRVRSVLGVARQHGIRSVIFVGHSMHSRRVKWSAQHILQEEPMRVIVSPTPESYFPEAYRIDKENWWKDERQLGIVVGACTRLVYYWFRYRLWLSAG